MDIQEAYEVFQAFSVLSDIQEMVSAGSNPEFIQDAITHAKRHLGVLLDPIFQDPAAVTEMFRAGGAECTLPPEVSDDTKA